MIFIENVNINSKSNSRFNLFTTYYLISIFKTYSKTYSILEIHKQDGEQLIRQINGQHTE